MSMTHLATSASGHSISKPGPKRQHSSTDSVVSQEQQQAASKRKQLDREGLGALEGQPAAARAVAAGAAAAADIARGPTPEERMKALLASSTPGTKARMLGVLGVEPLPDGDGAALAPLPPGLPLLPTADKYNQKAGKDVEAAAALRGRWRGRGSSKAVQQQRTEAGASRGRRPSNDATAGQKGRGRGRGKGSRGGGKGKRVADLEEEENFDDMGDSSCSDDVEDPELRAAAEGESDV